MSERDPLVVSQTTTKFPLPGQKPQDGEQTAATDELIPSEPAEEELSRAQRKARLAQVLERGFVHDRLIVELPPHLVGEWVRNDAMSVARKEALGFKVDTQYAMARALHSDGSDKPVVGDVVFMIIEREHYELFNEIRRDKFNKMNNRPKRQREEEDLEANIVAHTGGEIQAFADSQAHGARPSDIQEALLALASQRQTQ